jgi:hypothetical protein
MKIYNKINTNFAAKAVENLGPLIKENGWVVDVNLFTQPILFIPSLLENSDTVLEELFRLFLQDVVYDASFENFINEQIPANIDNIDESNINLYIEQIYSDYLLFLISDEPEAEPVTEPEPEAEE